MNDNDVWELNRPIVLTFNHPVDPASIGFGSIIIRPTDPANQGHPVVGSFSIQPNSEGKAVVFSPACPTNAAHDNGGFVPGGFNYELTLPTQATFGSSVLRDTSGHPLSVGLTRNFTTQTEEGKLFLDNVLGPPRLDPLNPVTFPAGLNLYTNPDPVIEIHFNQSVDASPTNISTDNIKVLYSDGEIGSGLETTFASTNLVPGQLVLVDNCTASGALVVFQITGVLPPNRNLEVQIMPTFQDLIGETNSQTQTSPLHATPTLTAYYQNDPNWNESDTTFDEFSDFFQTNDLLDPTAVLSFPPADFDFGQVTASFPFPGNQVSNSVNLRIGAFDSIELDTTGETTFHDSDGRAFVSHSGVIEVHDLTVEENGILRGRGANPLIIYATGTVTILGTLDVSGENAQRTSAISKPLIPEPGAVGECGGGDGGTASFETDKETLRGQAGTGAFGIGVGGGGGEGSVTFHWSVNGNDEPNEPAAWISAGGAGGTLVGTLNEAIQWTRWAGEADPAEFDDAGPDIRSDHHTQFSDPANIAAFSSFYGGEDGLRGNSWRENGTAEPPQTFPPSKQTYGGYGMEDLARDGAVNDRTSGSNTDALDPAWLLGNSNPFKYGHPTNGPDAGLTNPTPFQGTPDASDDFWGKRYNPFTDTLTVGEMATPWAGVGGGASGDSSIIVRLDLDGDSFLDPMGNFFPDPNFPFGSTKAYYKGAPGGGGGGQLQIMAVGPIILGPNTRLMANGGIGNGGESSLGASTNVTQQVSGSGGGSGGHIVLHSATGLDLSTIDVGTDPVNNPPAVAPDVVQAIGGRRGWSSSDLQTGSLLSNGDFDGNSDFMIGRGGAGGNGVIQIHVPDPGADIGWSPAAQSVIDDYIRHGVAGGPVDVDRVEEMLDLYCAPAPLSLIPIYSAKSQFQTRWIDTGLADLRLGAGFPDYQNTILSFAGIDPLTGSVQSTVGQVNPGATIASGTSGAAIGSFQVSINQARSHFASSLLANNLLRNAALLVGFDFVPDTSTGTSYEVASASYNRSTDVLSLTTSAPDGAMTAGPGWELRSKFFRVETTGQKDRLPDSAGVTFEFQGADESAPGLNTPGPPTAWVTDLSALAGKRFLRVRVTLDMDANHSGVTLDNERPGLQYFKIPFAW